MSSLTELERDLLEALGDMLKLADDAIENWTLEEIERHKKAAAVHARAEAKAKETQKCAPDCELPHDEICGQPFVDDGNGLCSNMAGLTRCCHFRACHLGTQG